MHNSSPGSFFPPIIWVMKNLKKTKYVHKFRRALHYKSWKMWWRNMWKVPLFSQPNLCPKTFLPTRRSIVIITTLPITADTGGIHKLRWKVRGEGWRLAKCQECYLSLCSNLSDERGRRVKNPVNVVYGCSPILWT